MNTATVLEDRHVELLAREVSAKPAQVRAADALFREGATVPFVARYRKELTGGLDDAQLETLAARRIYLLELVERRSSILRSIEEQGKLDDALARAINAAVTKTDLEDLYLPYKRKRRTRAQVAREAGLEPLADALMQGARSGVGDPQALASPHLDESKGIADVQAALAGARDILAERASETSSVRGKLRKIMANEARFESKVVPKRAKDDDKAAVYRDYFDHGEPARTVPSHRMLAILRGEKEGALGTALVIDDEREAARLSGSLSVKLESPCGKQVDEALRDGYRRLLRPSLDKETRTHMRERAEVEAIGVFRANLEALLLQAPLGTVPVLGIDPGLRTGAKLAAVDATGKVVATDVARMIPPKAEAVAALEKLLVLVRAHGVRAVAVGNGTGGRETESFVRKALAENDLGDVVVAIVPETGASVYSASPLARKELAGLDVSVRGAVSIARRLQDPLAELVKIQPRALGVGQYQHDVDQRALSRELDLAVERAVNRVGVELNTCSAALLRRVSGLNERLAEAIVARRDEHGAFRRRSEVLEVPGLGEKTFMLAGGFLRVRDGAGPLEATAVHPESYGLVERMAAELGVGADELVGNRELVAKLDLERFKDEAHGIGSYTLEDIRAELEEPGRDPRPAFRAPSFREDVQSIDDVQDGMELEGRVSNVTNFGAFVDLGVKRDGLVHISQLSRERVADPRDAVRVGEVVNVKVLSVDRERGRINLSIKALEEPAAPAVRHERKRNKKKGGKGAQGGRPGKSAQGGKPGKGGPKRQPASKRKPSESSLDALMKKFGGDS